ncbi:MAG: hypothetical protein V3S01_03055 [Dehalococcoidia bacterium]
MLIGWLVFLLCRRLVPAHATLAFLSGVFACSWAPQDFARLDTLALTGYSGLTLATCLAMLLFVESWRRGSLRLLLLAMAVAFTAARGAEIVMPLLAAAPLALLICGRRPTRQLRLWLALWGGLLLVATGLILRPLVFPDLGPTYQTGVLGGLDLTPLAVLGRLHAEYEYHLLPLALIPRGLMWHPGVPIAAAVFTLAWRLAAGRRGQQHAGPEARFVLLVCGGVGLILAGLGYAPYVLSPYTVGPARTQFLSAPGIAVFLASMICLLGTWVPRRWRQLAIAVLALWVVVVQTGRTLEMQRGWDLVNAFRWQTDSLAQLTARAPDLKPGTLVVIIDQRYAWRASFTFRHAVEYVYQGRATGHVWGGLDLLYPASFEPEGVRCDPWPSIREAWHAPATFHRHDEIVVVRYGNDGRLTVLEDWPDVLGGPAPHARYDPRSRILPAGAPVPQRAILSLPR